MSRRVGRIVVLNGAPRSGKSSIAAAIQVRSAEPWIQFGVDRLADCLPDALRPGVGLRPGGERPDLEPSVVALYLAAYDAIRAFSRRGFNVVADFGHHDAYSRSRAILPRCARSLRGCPAWLVGVRCPVPVALARRLATGYPADSDPNSATRRRIVAWEREVHDPGIYDLEVDTSLLTPEACADRVLSRLDGAPPTAFAKLAEPKRSRRGASVSG